MYPPEHHIERENEKSYRVIEKYSFATVISKTDDDVIVTQLPLILDRARGKYGFLIGHIDRNNPHLPYLNNANVSVNFHGPNTYISPTIYKSSQLPTWNSISVHIKGTVRTTNSTDTLKNSIIEMTSFLEQGPQPYVLNSDNQKMEGWLDYIVGFEIEIDEMIGRFKLSQDKSPEDMELAKQYLIEKTKEGSEELIDSLL